MARLWTDGGEFGDGLFWDSYNAGDVGQTDIKRSGSYAYRCYYSQFMKNIPDLSEFYFRLGIYHVNWSSWLFYFRHSTTEIARFFINSMGKLEYYSSGGSALATGTRVMSLSTWYLLEVYFKLDDSGVVTTRIDGIQDINYSGDTKPGADAHIDNFYFPASNHKLDDLALNDTSGGSDNSWCGDGHVELLKPVTGGTYAWTGSDGDSVDNYALVDDTPPNSDTDYVKSSTASQQDIYTLADFSGTGKVPVRIFAEARAKDNASSGGQIKLGYKTGGGTTSLGSAISLTGSYTRVVGTDALVNPDDSNPWEDADLDALQCVIECE